MIVMNILLMESHFRSRSWFKALKGLGDIYIVSVLGEEQRLFLSSGINESHVLNLHNPDIDQMEYLASRNHLVDAEKYYRFMANEVIFSDRTMRLKDHYYVTKYLSFLIKKIETFISSNDIGIVFIEPTWTHEILTCIICEKMGIPVWAPVKSKLVPDKFFFFSGYKNEIAFDRSATVDVDALGQEILNFIEINNKPQYFNKFSRRNKLTWSKFSVLYDISRLAIANDNNINIQPTWLFAVKKKLEAIMRAPFLMSRAGFCNKSDIQDPYVLVTLHVQPEASIDVVGSRYADQLNFIRCLARTTPSTHILIVKEHPHAFGDRKLSFYLELGAMPRVMILSPWEESRSLIMNADIVISNTGTSSLEASMMGVPGVTATRMYFEKLMVVPAFDPSLEQVSELLEKAKIWKEKFNLEDLRRELGKIKKNQFSGNCGDFKTDIDVMSSQNISKLRDAFREVIGSYIT
jgi:hypothetical protein